MGWMMGPWETFGTLNPGGAPSFLYDGAPDYPGSRPAVVHDRTPPDHDRRNLANADPCVDPSRRCPVFFSRSLPLKLFALTGEPCNPEPWRWLFDRVGKGRVAIINYTGGTEISGGILMSNLLLPMKPCSFNSPCPGIAADVYNEHGRPIRGEVGELVIKAPWIGMTRGFWKDPDRYEETYWSRWPGVWVHGDGRRSMRMANGTSWAAQTTQLKLPASASDRLKSKSILVEHPAVLESAAIAIPDAVKGNQMIVFCVLKPGYAPGEALRGELGDKIIANLGKSLAARQILSSTTCQRPAMPN